MSGTHLLLPANGKHWKESSEEEIKDWLVGERRFGRTNNKNWGKNWGKFSSLGGKSHLVESTWRTGRMDGEEVHWEITLRLLSPQHMVNAEDSMPWAFLEVLRSPLTWRELFSRVWVVCFRNHNKADPERSRLISSWGPCPSKCPELCLLMSSLCYWDIPEPPATLKAVRWNLWGNFLLIYQDPTFFSKLGQKID